MGFILDKPVIVGYSAPKMRRLIIKNTKSIRKRIYDHLREQLLSGDIPPYEHLIETKIAKEIGTSRTPV